MRKSRDMRMILWASIRILKRFFAKYLLCIIIGIILLFINMKIMDENINQVILNVVASLFALPIVFILYDVLIYVQTKKQRLIVSRQLNNQVRSMFISFLYMSSKFCCDFDSAIGEANSSFLDRKKATEEEIFKEISETKHSGFFLFSKFDDFEEAVNSILESQLFVRYADNYDISLLCDFGMLYHDFVSEFSYINCDDFILVGKDESLLFIE
jgi:hypothetical protein